MAVRTRIVVYHVAAGVPWAGHAHAAACRLLMTGMVLLWLYVLASLFTTWRQVYLGLDTRTGEHVAIKQLSLEKIPGESLQVRC